MHPTQNPAADPTDLVDWSPAELLRAAALYLQRYGWIQRNYFDPVDADPFPSACATGAIRAAATGTPRMDRWATIDGDCDASTRRTIYGATWALADHLGIDTDTDLLVDDIATWNDQDSRTREQVINALRAAADAYDIDVYGQSELDQDRNPTRDGYLQHRPSGTDCHDRDEHPGGGA
jgi:hypothetical protein